MSQINISGLTFSYDGSYDNIFEDVSFQIDTSWRLGFVGRNGRGKTTFLRLLMGQYEYRGSISASVDFIYFPFDVAHAEKSAMEAALQAAPGLQPWKLERELRRLRVDPDVLDRPFETLSRGEQTKVLLAALFQNDNGFLLIDEPTNHLDAEGRRIVADYLKSKEGFILVSHDRDFIDRCVTHILAINRAGIEVQRGNFSSWWENRQRQEQHEQAENERLKRDIRRLSEAARRTSDWSDKVEKTKKGTKNAGLRPDRGYIGHKAAKMMKRSKAIEERRSAAVQEKSALLKNTETAESLKLSPLRYFKNRLFECRDLTLFYGDKQVCGPLTFAIEQGDRAAIRGANGSGKSTLLAFLLGKEMASTGACLREQGLVVSHVPQDAGFLRGDMRQYADLRGIDESLFKAILRKMDFSRTQFEKDMSQLSAGQKKKVLLAESLCRQAHIYVWDEPLNYIDVFSRIQLEQLLPQARPTLLFVEHDDAFCRAVATKTIEL